MRRRINNTVVALVRADITSCSADAIVNAANSALAGGGGVDGAIHRAGGPAIADACREFPYLETGVKCPTGRCRTTTAGDLSATWVIHAVGPIYDSRDPAASSSLLSDAYDASLAEALRLGARSVVLPSLSTGAFRFPLRPAAQIALRAVASVIEEQPNALDEVTFALFSAKDLDIFARELGKLTNGRA